MLFYILGPFLLLIKRYTVLLRVQEKKMPSRFGVAGLWRMFNCRADAACALHSLYLINMCSYLVSFHKALVIYKQASCGIRVQFLGKFWLGMTLHAHIRLLWCTTFAHYTSANSDSTELYKSTIVSVNKRMVMQSQQSRCSLLIPRKWKHFWAMLKHSNLRLTIASSYRIKPT
jgi:hypothetical protein